MPADEIVKRLKGLKLGITSPGSTTDTMARTLFKARGMDPDQMVQLQPLGGGSNMLAALEKGLTDGFVWSAPQPQIAEKKGIGVIVIDPFERTVPEVIDVPYEVMALNKATIKENEDVIRKSIRAMTKGMKFAQEHPGGNAQDHAGALSKLRSGCAADRLEELRQGVSEIAGDSGRAVRQYAALAQHHGQVTHNTKYEDVVTNTLGSAGSQRHTRPVACRRDMAGWDREVDLLGVRRPAPEAWPRR